MGLLTIGAFAKASGLSPKALRLYDDLGLLAPAMVDKQTGYRHYRPDQLDQARLVAWLRRIGMPLARIATVTRLSPDVAAREVAAFWDQVEADVAARRALSSFLVEHLSRKDHAMTTDLLLRCAAVNDRGLVRPLTKTSPMPTTTSWPSPTGSDRGVSGPALSLSRHWSATAPPPATSSLRSRRRPGTPTSRCARSPHPSPSTRPARH